MRRSTPVLLLACTLGVAACGDDRSATGVDSSDATPIDLDGQGGADADISDDAIPDSSPEDIAAPPDSGAETDGSSGEPDADATGSDGADGVEDTEVGPPQACPKVETPTDTLRNVESGPISGEIVGGDVARFLGVRFAAAPVGPLRWAPPQAPPCHGEEPIAATVWPPLCAQRNEEGQPVGDEDCLMLNIWAPAQLPETPAPVVVFVPGGGNVIGGASISAAPGRYVYDGELWAREQQAVVVVLNYRLGILGWMTGTTAQGLDADVTGNFGLRDQIAALQWIQRNIAQFGGDPQKVMVFGESAGARNTCMLLASPATDGLFQGAVMQSGGCTLPPTEEVFAETAAFVDEFDECAGALGCLREVEWRDVIARYETSVSVASTGSDTQPWVDGTILPQVPVVALESGEAADVGVIVGANDDETSRDVPPGLTETQFNGLVRATFGRLADDVFALYALTDFDSPYRAWVALTSDVRFVCSTQLAADAMSTGGTRLWHYHFEQITSGSTSTFESWHGLELIYLFGTFQTALYRPSVAEEALGTAMRTAWTQLAMTGEPGPVAGVEPALTWPLWADGRTSLILAADNVEIRGGIRAAECEFWIEQLRSAIP